MKYLTVDEVNEFEAPDELLDELTDLVEVGELKLTESALCKILEFVGEVADDSEV